VSRSYYHLLLQRCDLRSLDQLGKYNETALLASSERLAAQSVIFYFLPFYHSQVVHLTLYAQIQDRSSPVLDNSVQFVIIPYLHRLAL